MTSGRSRSRSARRTRRPAGLLGLVLAVALAAWAVRSLVVEPFAIPSPSMAPALLPGDYVVVAKWPYGFSQHSFAFGAPAFAGRIAASLPERGDVVVFRGPDGRDYIKRVIGLPGDRIAMRGAVPLVDGRPLQRRSLGRDGAGRMLYRERLGDAAYRIADGPGDPVGGLAERRVPDGQLFLLGDNRDNSLDSRIPAAQGGIGMIATDRLIGRAERIIWSSDGTAVPGDPRSWARALRADRVGRTVKESE